MLINFFDKYTAYVTEPTVNYVYSYSTYKNGVGHYDTWYSYVIYPYGSNGIDCCEYITPEEKERLKSSRT